MKELATRNTTSHSKTFIVLQNHIKFLQDCCQCPRIVTVSDSFVCSWLIIPDKR
jgi:hypothetical protein